MGNREIKFRAWDLDYKWMDTDFYVRADSGVAYDKPSRVYDTPNIEIEENPNLLIMQYTGLKDAHGFEIYEGDIVRIEGFGSYVIEYNAPSFSLRLIGPCYELWMVDIELGECNCTVIGNIYQNPELLNG